MKHRLFVLIAAALLCAAAAGAAQAPVVDGSRPEAADTRSLIERLREIIQAASPNGQQGQPAGATASDSKRGKGGVCVLKAFERKACVYRCPDGSERRYAPIMEGEPPHPACPQIILPL